MQPAIRINCHFTPAKRRHVYLALDSLQKRQKALNSHHQFLAPRGLARLDIFMKPPLLATNTKYSSCPGGLTTFKFPAKFPPIDWWALSRKGATHMEADPPSQQQLLSLSWHDSVRIASLDRNNVMDYFSQRSNPFYDRTCNNEIVRMQRSDPAQLM